MNYMGDVAAVLGVELGEEFQTTYLDRTVTCKITSYGVELVGENTDADFSCGCLDSLLRGTSTITYRPWKPKYDQVYYIVDNDGAIDQETWLNTYVDMYNYKLGNCYRTYYEASANIGKWLSFYSSVELINF